MSDRIILLGFASLLLAIVAAIISYCAPAWTTTRTNELLSGERLRVYNETVGDIETQQELES